MSFHDWSDAEKRSLVAVVDAVGRVGCLNRGQANARQVLSGPAFLERAGQRYRQVQVQVPEGPCGFDRRRLSISIPNSIFLPSGRVEKQRQISVAISHTQDGARLRSHESCMHAAYAWELALCAAHAALAKAIAFKSIMSRPVLTRSACSSRIQRLRACRRATDFG